MEARAIHECPAEVLRRHDPDIPLLCFAPEVLRTQAAVFQKGFPGLVTYAVKANPDPIILQNLAAAGIAAFDVASVPEIERVAALSPGAALHYNNPVRARGEIADAVTAGVRSFSLDSAGEFDRLRTLVPPGAELTVRFKLPVKGAAYDFGAKFGATPEDAALLLQDVARAGYRPSLTFHPGTQCAPVEVWRAYIKAAGQIAQKSGVALSRLNVGGGFPAHRKSGPAPALQPIFDAISDAANTTFDDAPPPLLCEPGRAMVAECCTLLTRVRAVRGTHVFLNDGIYGGLAEMLSMPMTDRITVLAADGADRGRADIPYTVFGPTCDSLDRLPGEVLLPRNLAEGDAILFHGMGAYSGVTATRFNGFGELGMATVRRLSA